MIFRDGDSSSASLLGVLLRQRLEGSDVEAADFTATSCKRQGGACPVHVGGKKMTSEELSYPVFST